VAVLLLLQHPHFLFYTLLFAIPWSVEAKVTESLGTDLPDEPLMLLTAFAAMALFLSQKKKKGKHPIHGLLWILLIIIAWWVITVLASTQFTLSAKFLLAKGWYLLAFVAAPLLLSTGEKFIRNSAIVLFGSTMLVTLVILIRHATMGFTFATINDAVAPFFRNHVNYSALLVFLVPLQLAFYRLEKNKRRRAFLLASLLIVLAALYFSFARGAWLALAIAILGYQLLKKGWLLPAFLFSLLIIGSLIFWLQQNDRYLTFAPRHDVTVFHEDFAEHLIATYKGKDVSTAERFYRWVAGARMSSEHWLTGFGPTTFYEHYKSYTVPAFRTWVSGNLERSTVHNYFLLVLLEQGVPGLLLFLLLLGAMFWYAQKIYRRATDPFWKGTVAVITAILCMQCTLNFLSDLIETDKVGSVFYLCVAFLIIADRKTKKTEEQRKYLNTELRGKE
jgi:O-antigen ligase